MKEYMITRSIVIKKDNMELYHSNTYFMAESLKCIRVFATDNIPFDMLKSGEYTLIIGEPEIMRLPDE